MSEENPPSDDKKVILRSTCNSLIPVVASVDQLKSPEKEDSAIKSVAVERSPDAIPLVFRSLQLNTDISLPPDNWLGSRNPWERLIKQFIRPTSSTNQIPESFQLANDAIDVLPFIDVVSNSENLKKLLRVQFLSLAIHRVGQTFLIDNFDAYAYLLDAQKSDWHWIRKWFADNDNQRMALLLAANARRHQAKTREKIRQRDMLSKFLYYSIDESEVRQ